MLGPPPLESGTVATRKGRAWARERVAFERMLPKLARRHLGRYVVVCGGKVVGDDTDHQRLFETVWKRLDGRVFYIGRVGKEPPVIDMPGFVLESE